MTWMDRIVGTYNSLGGEAHYDDVYKFIEANWPDALTKSWKSTVRKIVEGHEMFVRVAPGRYRLEK
jgi:hypothetical protein